jgi:hypothetical protein
VWGDALFWGGDFSILRGVARAQIRLFLQVFRCTGRDCKNLQRFCDLDCCNPAAGWEVRIRITHLKY